MSTDHKNLISYQKAKELTKKTIRLSKILPYDKAVYTIYSQLIRSASSIGANIVEGYDRNNPREYKQFLGIDPGVILRNRILAGNTFRVHLRRIIRYNRIKQGVN